MPKVEYHRWKQDNTTCTEWLQAAYVRETENGKRTWKEIGWWCPRCRVLIEKP